MRKFIFIFSHKKAVSPLIATVVLIGFAVSIGAVIMSWGRAAFEKTGDEPEAEETANLAWYIGSNVENVCYTNNSISMTLKGSPKINIKSVFVASKGKQDYINDQNIELPSNENEAVNIKVPYDAKKYGEISKLILGAVDTAIISSPPQRCQ